MCNYGNGFNVMDLYHMPVHLRNFYYRKLVEAKEKENEQMKKSKSTSNSSKVRIKR
jgi:hypothetical protein